MSRKAIPRTLAIAVSAVTVAVLVPAITATAGAAPAPAQPGPDTTTEVIRPDGPLSPSSVTPQQRAALMDRHLQDRAKIAAKAPAPARGSGLVRPPTSPATRAGADGGFAPLALEVGRNERNDRATQVSNLLAEPAAANDGNAVFYSGNTYGSSSTDLGVNWADAAFPAGPADAPTPLGDPDVVRAHNVDRLFNILLYANGPPRTNGVVRIFVRNAPNAAPLCSYTIDPGGAADNVVPDYPHIGLTQNFLYLTLNNIQNGAFAQAQVRRFNLSQLTACVTVTSNTFNHVGTVGQRVLTPIEGAQNTTTMYFAAMEASSSLRIFRWPESSTAVSQVVRNLGVTSTFAEADCRGGTGDNDWMNNASGAAITAQGFRMRGARHATRITWFWNAAPDATHPQAHVKGASFRESDQVLLETPEIHNPGFCFGYPVISGNARGDLAISMGFGGQAGGGGAAAQALVGVDDTPADTIFFGATTLTATGTHNRTDGRYGDYFTVRPNARCQNAWVGTNYALLNGNTLSAHVNARYVEFGSNADGACF